ncbi:MAG: YCF48-related protein [Pyrinomonadaceae bacterium]
MSYKFVQQFSLGVFPDMEAELTSPPRAAHARCQFVVSFVAFSFVVLSLVTLAPRVLAQGGWVGARAGQAGRDLNTVYFANDKRGWIAGDAGVVFRTEDGGRTWARQPSGVEESVNDIYFRDKDEGYLLAGNQILTTDNGGALWHAAHTFASAEFDGASPDLYSVRFATKKRGWVVGSLSRGSDVVDSLVLYTDDGGMSWQRRIVPARVELLHLDFDGEKRGWIVGDRGIILHTEDAGATWTKQDSNTTATLYHVEFDDYENGWAVGERSTILRTNDGGKSWTQVRSAVTGTGATLSSVSFVNKDEGWIVGRRGLILRSSDGGRTWLRQESKTTEHLFALFFKGKTGWAVGGDGMVLQYER